MLNSPLLYNDPTGNIPIDCYNDPSYCSNTDTLPDPIYPSDNDDEEDGEDDDLLDNDDESLPEAIWDDYLEGWEIFESSWSIYWHPDATVLHRTAAGIYMGIWVDAHIMLAAAGILIAGEAVIIIGAKLATQNPNGTMVSIGNFANGVNDYVARGIQRGYTYFDLGRLYGPLNRLGLAKPINIRFMQNQINQGKEVITTILTKPGEGTKMEMEMLLRNGYLRVMEFFSHPAIGP